jgi:3-hydroxyacyl-[acyl-carrier-protein] dehydratase
LRYFLIDRIDELKKFEYALGTKCVSLAEDCFEHHFPGQPVYPGALLIEAMAQLGGALLELSLRDENGHCPRCVMSTVKAKFRDFARPGDTLALRAEVRSRHEDSAMVHVDGRRGEDRVCEAELLFVLLVIDDPRLEASRNALLDDLTRGTRLVE